MKDNTELIVLNIMYNGKYLNENMGHEVINLFKDDSGQNYLYLNPYGNFSANRNVKKMLMVIPVPKKNMFEVVALATGLEEVFRPVKNYNTNLNKEGTYANRCAYNEVREKQLDYIKINKILYGGIKLDELFDSDQQQAIYITYKAETVKMPKKRIFICFQNSCEGKKGIDEVNETIYLTLNDYKQAKMSQKQYISSDVIKDLYRSVDKLECDEWWEECPKVKDVISLKNTTEEDSFFDICGIKDSELAFSNALAYYIKKYPHLFKSVFDLNSDKILVEREYEYIDILIKDGETNIIVENKIHSSINCKKGDKDGESQLSRYWKTMTVEAGNIEKNVKGYILCPEYAVEQLKNDKSSYKCHEKYTIISYKNLFDALQNSEEIKNDAYFAIFFDAIRKHTYKTLPEAKYEDMKSLFVKRIIKKK